MTAGLDDSSFYRHGSLTLDPTAAARTVCAAVVSQQDSTLHGVTVAMAVDGDAIRLVGAATVDAVFGTAVPGFGQGKVRASAEATLQSGPATPAPLRPSAGGFGRPVPLQCG